MAEPDAGFHTVGGLYQEFVVRRRIAGFGLAVPDPGEAKGCGHGCSSMSAMLRNSVD
jgi:hypothetical protein